MISLKTQKKRDQEKTPKKWSSLISEKERETVIIKKPVKRRLEEDIIVVPKGISELIYPDILTSIMRYLSEEDYLNFSSAYPKIEEYSLRNSVYIQYLLKYRPADYKNIVDNMELYKSKILDIDPKYIYYDIHYMLYPELFDEEIPNIYGLSDKEAKIYRKKVKQKELYEKWKE